MEGYDNMIIERVFSPGLAQVAYLVGDDVTGKMAVIDPRRDIDEYLRIAAEKEMEIVAILETHVHADFVSGARELSNGNRCADLLQSPGRPGIPSHTARGWRSRSGWLALPGSLLDPGHTPEHIGFLLTDPAQRPEPARFFQRRPSLCR